MSTEYQKEQAERRETLENDRRLREQQTSTLHQHAQAQADELSQGRFRATGTPIVTGTTAVPSYPPGPAWCAGDQGLEPALGVDINALEPCGEAHEIRASIAAQDAPTLEQPTPFSSAQGNSDDPTVAPSTKSPGLMPKRVGSSPFTDDEPPEAA